MQNEHVLSGLVRKRSEIAGQIEHAQAELRKLVTDLDAIDAAIRIFDPTADTGAIPSRQYPPLHAAFRGEMMRFVLGALRVATAPVTSREIADAVMDGRGPNKADPKSCEAPERGSASWPEGRGGSAETYRMCELARTSDMICSCRWQQETIRYDSRHARRRGAAWRRRQRGGRTAPSGSSRLS